MSAVAEAAWHEAGHAIVAKQLDCGDVSAEVRPDGSGVCSYQAPPAMTPGDLEPMRRAVMIGMAGHIAEAVAAGEPVPSAMTILTRERKAGTSAMFRLVEKAAKVFDGDLATGEEYVRALLDDMHKRTCAILNEHWKTVDALAARLALHGSADDIYLDAARYRRP